MVAEGERLLIAEADAQAVATTVAEVIRLLLPGAVDTRAAVAATPMAALTMAITELLLFHTGQCVAFGRRVSF
jgi:hypothetical protein